MQIDRAWSQMPSLADRAMTNSQSAANEASAVQPMLPATTSAQDDAVHISAVGAAAEAQDGDATQKDGHSASRAAESATESGASAVRSFAYGTLGLERPDQPQDEGDAFYTAGRWLAAGITVGGIVSLLV